MGSPAPDLQVTASLKLVKELSTGTMGSVWIAEHLTLKTQFAVKFISPGLIEADPTALVRFTNEARAAASIKSPHVVSTSDYGVTDDGEPYIVMELLNGETLYELLLREGPLDVQTVATVILQVCRGLTAAHDLGILHRDIKPENIFVCEGEEPQLVKVIDFGLAKLTEGDTALMPTQAGAQVGTPAFMSPEQIDADKPVDHRADLWGTAVVVYHALTGKHPFRGQNVAEFRDNIRNQKFTPATVHNPALPTEIDAWFQRGLQGDPAKRFQSAIALSDALIEALGLADDVPILPAMRTSVPSMSGMRYRPLELVPSVPPSEPPVSGRISEVQRMSLAHQELEKKMQRRTRLLVGLCLVLLVIAIGLALR